MTIMTIKQPEAKDFERACRLIENVARSLGPNCQIIFAENCVSIAPLSWPGDSTGDTLYEAFLDAMATTR